MKVFQIWQNFKSGPILARAEFVKKRGRISAGVELGYSPKIISVTEQLTVQVLCSGI